jgi:hypothetical protein
VGARFDWSESEPIADIEFRADIVGIPRADTELDTLVLNGLTALGADDLAGDLVPRIAVMQRDGCAASVVKPFVSPGEHARQDWEKVAAHVGEQVLVTRGIVLVEPFGHDPGVHELSEPVRQRVAGDVQGPLELVEARESLQCVADDEQRPGITEDVDGTG